MTAAQRLAWSRSRYEYAFFLRSRGMKLRLIGERLGVSLERARQMIRKCERRGWHVCS